MQQEAESFPLSMKGRSKNSMKRTSNFNSVGLDLILTPSRLTLAHMS
jgi:hypothetical protein